VARRPPNRRYTYGYGRAEDLAGVVIVLLIAASSALAGWQAVTRLAHPRPMSALVAVAAAALAGFAGNELVAGYRIRAGRSFGSAALVADGLHARTDGFTSLAVLLGAGQVRLRWIGHRLRAECEVIVDAAASAVQAHQVAVNAEHALLHALPRLSAALVHADPQPREGVDDHAVLAPHRPAVTP
jgi:divalent metal cation (Fe/Co/Zn/Cd) transporter